MISLKIIDIANPASPALAGSLNTPGAPRGLFVSGGYAYLGAGDDGGLQVIDVSNPASPNLSGYYDTLGAAVDVFVSGSHAYVATYWAGLRIFDISGLP